MHPDASGCILMTKGHMTLLNLSRGHRADNLSPLYKKRTPPMRIEDSLKPWVTSTTRGRSKVLTGVQGTLADIHGQLSVVQALLWQSAATNSLETGLKVLTLMQTPSYVGHS